MRTILRDRNLVLKAGSVAIILVIILLYKFVRSFKNFVKSIPFIGSFFKESRKQTEIIPIEKDNLMLPKAYYLNYANRIESLLYGWTSDTQRNAVIEILRVLNSDELKEVFNFFGIRDYISGEGNLIEWLESEDFTSSQLSELKLIFQNSKLW